MNRWIGGLIDNWITGFVDAWMNGLRVVRALAHPFIQQSIRPPIHSSILVALALLAAGCSEKPPTHATAPNDPRLATNGTVEVTAKLLEIPDGAIFKRDLYDYATILKYQVVKVHRGAVAEGSTIFVGHYNPWKPRSVAADRRVKVIGGTLRQFQAEQLHHLALEVPLEDHFMGGIVNKYFGQTTNVVYWAVWTNQE